MHAIATHTSIWNTHSAYANESRRKKNTKTYIENFDTGDRCEANKVALDCVEFKHIFP